MEKVSLRQHVQGLAAEQNAMWGSAPALVTAARERSRRSESRGDFSPLSLWVTRDICAFH